MADYRGPYRVAATSAANGVGTAASPVNPIPLFLKYITVKYSGTVTQNVTVTLDCGAGPAYDCLLQTIAISSGTQGTYFPAVPLPIAADDQIVVSAPAGGVGVTSSIAIYCDRQMS